MFTRLLLAFITFGMLGAVGFLALSSFLPFQPGNAPSRNILHGLGLILLDSVVMFLPAWWFAYRFVRPFHELTDGAKRIAEGEYGHSIHGGVWGESRSLAKTFNAMSKRLAMQFAQLEADRTQLRTILDGMVEGVLAVDADQRVLFANDQAGRLLDFSAETAVGRAFWEISRQPQLQAVVQGSIVGTRAQRIELDWKGPVQRNLAIYAAPLPNDTPQQGAVMVVHDVSELRRLERLRQDFVANVSHELKTPLSVIKACIEALMDGAVDDPNARKPFMEQISDQAERLHALILDLLSLARIESGEEMLDFTNVPLLDLVQECLERHQARADAKGLTLRGNPEKIEKVDIWADEEALSQILDNLIDNAVKYTKPGSWIEVSWSSSPEYVVIDVRDNGPGIPERDLPRIFERFYRVDKARSRELGGTGLGLAIVKHLVQCMHGTVKASSQLGHGTTFTLTLPRRPQSDKSNNSGLLSIQPLSRN
jgi:two-component system, OmpR family, phosphate regulon sensor histidine kinase PhoR